MASTMSACKPTVPCIDLIWHAPFGDIPKAKGRLRWKSRVRTMRSVRAIDMPLWCSGTASFRTKINF